MNTPISVYDQYNLLPDLLDKNNKTLGWLSASMLWKNELILFQRLLNQCAPQFSSVDDKKKLDYFQNLLHYYRGEVVDTLTHKLRQHEKFLADVLKKPDKIKTEYLKNHDLLTGEMEAFNTQLTEYKAALFIFMEPVL